MKQLHPLSHALRRFQYKAKQHERALKAERLWYDIEPLLSPYFVSAIQNAWTQMQDGLGSELFDKLIENYIELIEVHRIEPSLAAPTIELNFTFQNGHN